MLEGLIQPLKVKGLPLTSAGFGSDFKTAEMEDLWPAGPGRQRGIELGSTSLLQKKRPVPPALPPASGKRMQQHVPLYYYQNLLWISLSQQIQETIWSGQIYYRRQDPHIRNLNTDLLQLPTVFLSHWNFVNLEQFWHTRMKSLRRKTMAKSDIHICFCQHEFCQSWGHLHCRWQQRVEVAGWLGGSSAAMTSQGHVCTA